MMTMSVLTMGPPPKAQPHQMMRINLTIILISEEMLLWSRIMLLGLSLPLTQPSLNLA
jgi:hypothetical protein